MDKTNVCRFRRHEHELTFQNIVDLKDSQFETQGTGVLEQHQHPIVHEQDQKKAQNALHEDIRSDDQAKGAQIGSAQETK